MINANFTSFPLSPWQHDIWVTAAQFPDNNQYTILSYIEFSPNIDEDVLEAAIISVARQTDVFHLRVNDENGSPRQWLVKDDELPIIHVDLTHEDNSRTVAKRWLNNAFTRHYALNGKKLVDISLLRTTDAIYLHISTHHIVSDAWGLQVFMNQVRKRYLQSQGEAIPELAASHYVDTVATDIYSGSEQHRADRHYFSEKLAQATPVLFNRKTPYGSRQTARYTFQIARSVLATLRDRAESPFLFLSAAVALYLARIHRSDEIVLGVPVLNRADRATKQTVGHFANTLPLRIETSPSLSIGEFLLRLRNGTRELLRHQRLPLGDLGSQSARLFDTTLSWMRWPTPAAIPNVTAHTVAHTHAHQHDALAIWVSEFDSHQDAQVDLQYGCDVFDNDFPVQAAVQHIKTLFLALVDADDQHRSIADIFILLPAEFQSLIYQRNATATPFPDSATLPGLFALQASRTPNRVAVIEPDGTPVTFRALQERAISVAVALRAAGVMPDDRVAVLLARGTHLLPAILGVQLAGGAYIPVDPGYPAERINLLLEESGARVTLIGNISPALTASTAGKVLRMQDIPPYEQQTLSPVVEAGHLAYVIFTSGSTGKPKGVMIEHRAVVNRLAWMQRCYPIDQHDVLLQKTPVSFDVSVWELFWWSFTGASVALLPPGAEKDPREVLRVVEQASVTMIHFVPSMLSPFLDLLENEVSFRDAAASLRRVFCSGEALAPAQVARFKRLFGDRVQLVNLYGPTEAAIDVSHYVSTDPRPTRIPIGTPIDNIHLYVLDNGLRPQPSGVSGELFIGGVGLARGYLNRPDLTRTRFMANPYIEDGRLYRTGDLTRWLADGTLEYLGRIDDQVKIRGNRVEPSEVQDALASQAGVRDAAVVVGNSPQRGNYLIGYCISDAPLDIGTLRAGLAARLPEFMIPAFFVRMADFPLTANGKLDRKRLPLPEVTQAHVAPRTPAEQQLADVWAEVLGVPAVGIYDDFFTLGGDSILMLRLRAGAQRRGLSFELAELMRNPTIAGLAEHVRRAAEEQSVAPFGMVAEVDKPRLSHLEDAFPMAQLSLGLVFHTRQRAHSAVYRDVFHYRFGLAWDEEAFRQAVMTVVARFPALRSAFDLTGCSEPLQCVHFTVGEVLQVFDLRGAVDPDSIIDAHIQQRRFHDYALEQPPLYLFAAFIGETEFSLVFSFHHAILDGWSVGQVITTLIAAYQGETEPYAAPSLASFIREERRALASPLAARYWRELLQGATMTRIDGFSAHEQPGDREAMSPLIRLPAETVAQIKQLAAAHALPPKSLFLAAHCLTLHLFSRSETVVTVAVTHGRPDLNQADSMVGLFLNTVLVRSEIAGHTWIEVANALFQQERDGHPYRRYPLSAVLADCGDTLPTAFNCVNLHVLAPLNALREFRVWEETNFSLFINVISTPLDNGMFLRVDGDKHAITAAQAKQVGQMFIAILQRMAHRPDDAVDFGFLAPQYDVVPQRTPLVNVVTRFERQCQATPGNAVVTFGDIVWRYQKLDGVSQVIATRLAGLGAKKGDVIGVAMNRAPETIAVIWGILRAGWFAYRWTSATPHIGWR